MTSLKEKFYGSMPVQGCPVIDLHGHMGPFGGAYLPGSELDPMIAGMDRAGVRKLFFAHHAALASPETGNAPSIEAVRKYPDRLKAYAVINPHYPEIAERELKLVFNNRDVFAGLKFHGESHGYPLTGDGYRPAWEFAAAHGLIVLVHTWGVSEFNGPAQVRAIAERYPGITVILGHSFHGKWEEAVKAVRDFPNLYLDLCAVLDDRPVLEYLVREAGSGRITFGTDYPWFSLFYYIGAVLGADIADEDRRNIFYRNAQKILKQATGNK